MKPKRPKDPNQVAKLIADIATGDVQEAPHPLKDKKMSDLGRKGGLKGGKARAKKLSAKRRKEIAKKAAKARWKKDK